MLKYILTLFNVKFVLNFAIEQLFAVDLTTITETESGRPILIFKKNKQICYL